MKCSNFLLLTCYLLDLSFLSRGIVLGTSFAASLIGVRIYFILECFCLVNDWMFYFCLHPCYLVVFLYNDFY